LGKYDVLSGNTKIKGDQLRKVYAIDHAIEFTA
jgi:hypothetical protein